jgi:hypothetical protein
MDNVYNQSDVAYESSPKETNTKRRMPDGDKQFGKEKDTMSQDSKPATKGYVKKVMAQHVKKMHKGRHKEHR